MAETIVKRIQGRPTRGEGDVGRDKLIEAARSILRVRANTDISRKAVAEAAGVTPALVSYYFPDKGSLLAAATKPVVAQRLVQLHAILDAPASVGHRLRDLIALFIGFNEVEAHLLDYYIDLCRDDVAGRSQKPLLTAAHQRIMDFYVEGVATGDWRPLDPDLFFLALWGMCKFVAQARFLPVHILPRPPEIEGRPRDTVDAIIDLALNGIQRRV